MKLYRYLLLIGLLMLGCVTMASAGGMAMFKVACPENVNTGDIVTATIIMDNNLNPVAADIALVVDWDGNILQYQKTDFLVGNTTSTELYGTHTLEMLFGDFTKGYRNGEYDMAMITFVAIGPGETTPKVRVHRMNDIEENDISGKTEVKATTISVIGDAITGPIPTVAQTTVRTVATVPTVQQAVTQIATQVPGTQPVQTWPAVTQQQSWPLPGQQVTVAPQQGLQQGASSGFPAAATTIPTLFPGTAATPWPPAAYGQATNTSYQPVQTYQSVYQNNSSSSSSSSSSGIQTSNDMNFQSFVAASGQSQNYNPNGSSTGTSTGSSDFNSLIETSQTTIPPTQNGFGIQKDSSFTTNNKSTTNKTATATTTTAKKSGSMFGLLSVAALAGVALIAARQRKNE